MARKNGTAPKTDDDEDRFSVYTTRAEGQEIRDFCWEVRMSFNAMAIEAIRRYMAHRRSKHSDAPRISKLPPGPSLRPKK